MSHIRRYIRSFRLFVTNNKNGIIAQFIPGQVVTEFFQIKTCGSIKLEPLIETDSHPTFFHYFTPRAQILFNNVLSR